MALLLIRHPCLPPGRKSTSSLDAMLEPGGPIAADPAEGPVDIVAGVPRRRSVVGTVCSGHTPPLTLVRVFFPRVSASPPLWIKRLCLWIKLQPLAPRARRPKTHRWLLFKRLRHWLLGPLPWWSQALERSAMSAPRIPQLSILRSLLPCRGRSW